MKCTADSALIKNISGYIYGTGLSCLILSFYGMLPIPHEVIHRLFFGGFSSDVCEKESGQGSLTIRDQQQNPSGPLIEFDADHSRHPPPQKAQEDEFPENWR